MYLHLFLLLFSSGASGYFLPLKEMLHLQNKTKYAIIDEMLCLLRAEKESINVQFSTPLHIKNQSCAHNITEKFIRELRRIPGCRCMKRVEKDMERLEKNCTILKKSSSKDGRCSQSRKTDFTLFKESLEEFLQWVNQKQYCSNVVRTELSLYPDDKCSCSDPWKYHKALF
ncbi:hypothetical protein AV530_008212 [Patagioenas fasciata monilis]|uniref:Interleukin-7 n=1 Tax=Patagioenas fasciata monilis TaxID=372326 RepID=A0A1V4KW96_PATFA|nr:hypothetical protein AV530_008212 [Patagioenas fasciata monilis]